MIPSWPFSHRRVGISAHREQGSDKDRWAEMPALRLLAHELSVNEKKPTTDQYGKKNNLQHVHDVVVSHVSPIGLKQENIRGNAYGPSNRREYR